MTRPVAAPLTPATSAALPPLAPARTITASPSCCLSRSTRVAQRLGVEAFQARGQHLDAADVDWPTRARSAVAPQAALALSASSSRSSFFWRSSSCRSLSTDLAGGAAEQARGFVEALLLVGDVVERALPGQRLDAAHAGGDAAFGDDLEQADVAGAADVGAAAQLGRGVAHPQHAHALAVLLAEQRHRAEIERFLHAHLVDFGRHGWRGFRH